MSNRRLPGDEKAWVDPLRGDDADARSKADYDAQFGIAKRHYEADLAEWLRDKDKWRHEWCTVCGHAKSPVKQPIYDPPKPRQRAIGLGGRRGGYGGLPLSYSTLPDVEAPAHHLNGRFESPVRKRSWWKSQESQPRPQWCRGPHPPDLHRLVTGIGELEDSNRPTGNVPAGAGLVWTPEQQKRMGKARSKRPVVRVARTASIADEIRNLSALRDEGVITESEFQLLKQRLIKGG